MEEAYEDLKGFLVVNNRSDLRFTATAAVLQQIHDRENLEKMVRFGFVEPLVKNAAYPEGAVACQALRALVFMTSNGTSANQAVQDLFEARGIPRLVEVTLAPWPNASSNSEKEIASWRRRVNFCVALLANLTRNEEAAVEMVGHTFPNDAVPTSESNETLRPAAYFQLLLSRFLDEQYVDHTTDYAALVIEEKETENTYLLDTHAGDPYQHFASILTNVSQVEAGRQFVTRIHRDKDGNEFTVLQRLLPILKTSKNPLRRRGIAGVVRNSCQDSDSSWWMLNVVQVTKFLLFPLAGPEELDIDEKQGLDPDLWLEGPDKQREQDRWTRLFLVESILLLCASGRKARETLRLQRVYVILKWADMVEEDEEISAQIYDCVNFLRRDEEGTAEGSSDKSILDAYRKSLPPSIGTKADLNEVD